MIKLRFSIQLATVWFYSLTAMGFQNDPTLSHMNPVLWNEDLEYLVKKTEDFALFTTESKKIFYDSVEILYRKLPNLDNATTVIEFNKLLAMLEDGHTELNLIQLNTGFHLMPLLLRYFGDELRVINTRRSDTLLLGARVISIGGVKIPEIHEKVIPHLAHDNEMEFVLEVPNYILAAEFLQYLGIIPDTEKVDLILVKNGIRREVEMAPVPIHEYIKIEWKRVRNTDSPPLHLQNLDKSHWYKYFESEKLMYFRILRFNNPKGETKLKKLSKEVFKAFDRKGSEKLAIDLRLNRGGNYELGLSIVEEIRKRPDLNRKGKLFILTDRTTFSAAGTIAAKIHALGGAMIVGELSRDNPNGADNYEPYDLPNSDLSFGITDRIKVNYPGLTGPQLPLDKEILTSFEDFKNGIDPVMEYVIDFR